MNKNKNNRPMQKQQQDDKNVGAESKNQNSIPSNPESLEGDQGFKSVVDNQGVQIKPEQSDLEISDYEAFQREAAKQSPIKYLVNFQCLKITKYENLVNFQSIEALRCTRRQLIDLAVGQMMQNPYCQHKIGPQILTKLVEQIARGYHSIAYHNFSHGFTLMQLFAVSLNKCEQINGYCSDEEKMLYMLAALAHDINHKGTNNQFEVKMKSQLAIQAKNEAVLEKMHAGTMLNILRQNPDFEAISTPQANRELIVKAILATDMSSHFQHIQEMRNKREKGQTDFSIRENRQLILNQLFHASDIGTGTLELPVFLNWSCLVISEFDSQTQLEKINGLEVSGFMKYEGVRKTLYQGQSSFLGQVTLPLWKELSLNLPGLNPRVLQMEDNIKKLRALGQQQESKEKQSSL